MVHFCFPHDRKHDVGRAVINAVILLHNWPGDVSKSSCIPKSEQPKSEQIKSEQANPNKPEQDLSKYSAQELYSAIALYPEDTWKESPEYKQLMKNLKNKSLEQLRDEGYLIPNWKRCGKK